MIQKKESTIPQKKKIDRYLRQCEEKNWLPHV